MGPFSQDMGNLILKMRYFVEKMISLLLTITLQVFIMRKRAK